MEDTPTASTLDAVAKAQAILEDAARKDYEDGCAEVNAVLARRKLGIAVRTLATVSEDGITRYSSAWQFVKTQ